MQYRVAFPNFIKIKKNNKTGLKSTKRLGIIFLAGSQLKKDHPMEMHFRTRQSQKTSFFSLWYLESLSKLSGGTTIFSASFFLSTLVAAHRMFLFIHGDTCSFVRSFERSTVQVTSFMHTERHTVWATEDHFIKCFFCSFVRSFVLACLMTFLFLFQPICRQWWWWKGRRGVSVVIGDAFFDPHRDYLRFKNGKKGLILPHEEWISMIILFINLLHTCTYTWKC